MVGLKPFRIKPEIEWMQHFSGMKGLDPPVKPGDDG